MFLVLLTLTGIGTTYLFREQIIHQFITEVNKYIKTPVHTDRPVISFQDFPKVGIMFSNVYIEESYPDSKAPLAKLDKVLVSFNPFNLLMNDYTVDDLTLIRGRVNLKVNKEGLENYLMFEKAGENSAQVSLKLEKIRIIDVDLTYDNLKNQSNYALNLGSLESDLNIANDQYGFNILGDATVQHIRVVKDSYFQNRKINVDSWVVYDDFKKSVQINNSRVQIGNAFYDLTGSYGIAEESIDLSVQAEAATVQVLISLLPDRISKSLKKYRSEGDIYFKGKIFGSSLEPSMEFDIGSNNARITHPDYNITLNNLNAQASIEIPSLKKLETAKVNVKDFSATFKDRTVAGNIMIDGLKKSRVTTDLKGILDLQDLHSFYPIQSIHKVGGQIEFDISFDGLLDDLKSRASSRRVATTGQLTLQDVSIDLASYDLPIENLSGALAFNNNDLSIDHLNGVLGNSDFELDGVFRNIIAFLLFDDQPIGVEAKLSSNFIDLDEIFDGTIKEEDADQYSFGINPKLFLAFDCTIAALRFRRFEPKGIRGTLKIKDQLALGRDLYAEAFGGNLTMNTLVDARKGSDIKVELEAKMKNINADRAFYVFENFGQDWIREEHLKGEVDAELTAVMAFDEKLKLKSDRLVSDINFLVKNGQLNDFEPLLGLSKYVEDKNLSRLRVAEISNAIHIENKTVYLPQMEVRTNVSNIMMSGTHTFDQDIDYRVIIPLKTWLGDKNDPAFGAVEEDEFGKSKLFLRIIGTTRDYKIVYDKEGVKNKIVADLKKEVQELKNAIKNNGEQKKATVELDEDEYFDWENDN